MTDRGAEPIGLGKADWLYERPGDEPDFLDGLHIPCCSVLVEHVPAGYRPAFRPCHNGPLVGDQIESGDCGEH